MTGPAISTSDGWRQRRGFVELLMVESMCEILRRQRADGTSLAVFRPKRVLDILIVPADVSEEKRAIARAWAAQTSLLDGLGSEERSHQLRELEVVPWTFKYHYVCSDPECNGHKQSIIDWEIVGTYRKVRNHPNWQEKVRQRWLGELCSPSRDTAFFVGNQHQHPGSFLVLGVWWPPRQADQLVISGL